MNTPPLSVALPRSSAVHVPATRRAAMGVLLGFGGTLAMGLSGRIPTRAGGTALWAADRAGHRVFGLDADGMETCSFPVTAPAGLRALGPRRAWVVYSAPEARRDGPWEELFFGPRGEILARRPWARTDGPSDAPPAEVGGPLAPLSTGHSASSLDGNRLWTVQRAADLSQPKPRPDGTRPDGTRPDGTQPAGARPAGAGGDHYQHLCRWVHSGGVWARAFHLRLPFRTRAFAPTGAGVWVGDEARCRLWFVSRHGDVSLRRTIPDADGIDALLAATPASGGGVWAAAGGAIVRLDTHGNRMPGQGGFLHVVDLCAGPGVGSHEPE